MNIISHIAEYYVDNNFIGYLPYNYNGEVIGYQGKQYFVAEDTIVIKRKKIAKGTKYLRIVYSLQGKLNK
jgi:hypothetical protein